MLSKIKSGVSRDAFADAAPPRLHCRLSGTAPYDESHSLSVDERNWIARMRAALVAATPHAYIASDYNLLRWARAYAPDIDTAAKKCRRHLRVRQILALDLINAWTPAGHGVDDSADIYAPLSICGEIGMVPKGSSFRYDNRILLIEKSGKCDLPRIMQNARLSAFMMSRFRIMERILQQIQAAESRTSQPSSAVIVIDLNSLVFHSGLVGFLSGPYRIIWGTLIEQYPSIISQIFVINSPTFINILWNACSKFIPAEYSKRIHLFGDNWKDLMKDHLPLDCLPIEYGGRRDLVIPDPIPDQIHSLPAVVPPSETDMETISIPAGSVVIHTFYLHESELLEFFMKHEHAFTMNIFYTPMKKSIENFNEDIAGMEEVYAGCERPGSFPQLDFWNWQVPYTGFYHAIFGNEKAWIMPVSVCYQIFQIYTNNGARIKVNRIDVNLI